MNTANRLLFTAACCTGAATAINLLAGSASFSGGRNAGDARLNSKAGISNYNDAFTDGDATVDGLSESDAVAEAISHSEWYGAKIDIEFGEDHSVSPQASDDSTDGSATGGDSSDSSATGGDSSDGSTTGGDSSDGSATGGDSSDGSATGGDSSDGSATCGDSSDGSATGGDSSNGAPTVEQITEYTQSEIFLENLPVVEGASFSAKTSYVVTGNGATATLRKQITVDLDVGSTPKRLDAMFFLYDEVQSQQICYTFR